MKKKKMKRNRCSAGHSSAGDHSRGKFVTKCGTILLVAASYQVFPLCMDPAGQHLRQGQEKGTTLLGKASTQISSVFVTPAIAAPSINECRCVGGDVGRGCGCTGCMGCMGCQGCQSGCTGYTGYDAFMDFERAFNAGRWEEAEAAARREIQLKPEASSYGRLGRALYMQGRFAEAEAAYRRSISVNSNYSIAHHNLGVALQQQGRYEEAIKAFERALQIEPGNSIYIKSLGDLKAELVQQQAANLSKKADELYNKNDLVGAEAAYREVISIKPNDTHSHRWLGAALFHQARYADAEAALRRAVKLDPKNVDVYVYLGVSLERQGKLSEAETEYRAAMKLAPSNDYARNNLAGLLKRKGGDLYEQGKFSQAEAAAREAIHLNPKNDIAHNILGISLWKQGKLSEAEKELRQAMTLNPNWAKPRENLSDLLVDKGKSLYTQGKTSEAEAAFREALALNPVSPTASQALALIKMSGAAPSTAPASPAPSSPSLAGLEFIAPATKPIGQQGAGPQGTITLMIREDGRYVPVTFTIPDRQSTGPIQAMPQLQSVQQSGAEARGAATGAGGRGDATAEEASHVAGEGFDSYGRRVQAQSAGVVQGSSGQQQPVTPQPRVLPKELLQDKDFRDQLNKRAALLEKQQELASRLDEVERKRQTTTNQKERGDLEMEMWKIKQQQSSIPREIRKTEIDMADMVDRSLKLPGQEKATEKNQPATPQPSSENVKEKSSGGKAQ